MAGLWGIESGPQRPIAQRDGLNALRTKLPVDTFDGTDFVRGEMLAHLQMARTEPGPIRMMLAAAESWRALEACTHAPDQVARHLAEQRPWRAC